LRNDHYTRKWVQNKPGAIALQRLFSAFPARWPGLGLLLLRLAVGLTYLSQGASHLLGWSSPTPGIWLTHLAEIAIGASLLLGFLTPIASLAATLMSLGFMPEVFMMVARTPLDARLSSIDSIAVTVALAFLGPGAFSVDAYLFGRREIIIPDTSHTAKH